MSKKTKLKPAARTGMLAELEAALRLKKELESASRAHGMWGYEDTWNALTTIISQRLDYAPLRWSELPTRAGWWWLVIDHLATEPEIVLVQQIYTHGMTFFRACSPRERDVRLYPGRRWAGPIELPAMPDIKPEHNP